MKKIVYIGILFLALVATSCSKEEVVVANDSYNVPEWNNSNNEKKSDSGSVDDGNSNPVGNGTVDNGGTVVGSTPIGNSPVGEITDPNNDPDGKKKKF